MLDMFLPALHSFLKVIICYLVLGSALQEPFSRLQSIKLSVTFMRVVIVSEI